MRARHSLLGAFTASYLLSAGAALAQQDTQEQASAPPSPDSRRAVSAATSADAEAPVAAKAAAVPDQGAPVPAKSAPTAKDENPWKFEVTNTSSGLYNGDNRDTLSGDVGTFTNDNWGLLYNRLDTQATSGAWVLSLRLDGAWFYTRPNPTQVGLDMVQVRRNDGGPGPGEPSDAEFFRQKVFEAGSDLSNRTINWIIPAKYSAAYQGRDAQVTVGDFYAQFGRGMVLSVRKQDALASDTTLRGARLTTGTRLEKTRIKASLIAGSGNPLRIDETSGRYLGSHRSAKRGFQHVTEAGMPWAIDTDYSPNTGDCLSSPTCSYAPDDLFGAQLQFAPPQMKFSTQASYLSRHTTLSQDVVRSSKGIFTASQSIEFPSLVDFGALYFEGAGQNRSYEDSADKGGYALYGNIDLYAGMFQLLLEGKHYRAFYPLSAGTSSDRAPEFNQVQYSQVPTTEAVWNTSQFENFNTCTSGGRGKLDAHLSSHVSVFTWLGRYDTWAESVSNEECETSREKRNQVWDVAVGSEMSSADRRSKTNITVGARDDTTSADRVTAGGTTRVFYREAYTRYDALFHLSGPYSLQFQGWHRYRNQVVGGPENPWFAGTTSNALEIAPYGNISLGIEYDTNPLTPGTYFNGQVTYRMNSASNLSLFVGQRRGEQRCVAGVCRVFPAFEGARLDLTLRH